MEWHSFKIHGAVTNLNVRDGLLELHGTVRRQLDKLVCAYKSGKTHKHYFPLVQRT